MRCRLPSIVIFQPLKRCNFSSQKLQEIPGDVVSCFHCLEKNVIFLFKECYNYYHQASGHFTPNHTMLFRVSLLPQMFKTSCLNLVFKSELGIWAFSNPTEMSFGISETLCSGSPASQGHLEASSRGRGPHQEHPSGVLRGKMGLLKLSSLPRTSGCPDVSKQDPAVQHLVRQVCAHSPAQLHRKNGLYFVYKALWD